MTEHPFLLYDPTVYTVRQHYEIVFFTQEPGAAWVLVEGRRYTDQMCGVVRSDTCSHHVCIPTEALDRAGGYTVCYALIPERHSYFPKTEQIFTAEYPFRALPDGEIHVYMLADTHSHVEEPVAVSRYFGEAPDLLILGGDNGNTASNPDSVLTMTKLASAITHGTIPVIYMRGNHDTRGAYAEHLPEYVGTDRGNTFFPFRLGRLWGVVLDAGEDKTDDHAEYGDIADYTAFREEQTEMLREIPQQGTGQERLTESSTPVRLALCHIPFQVIETPFPEVFDRWTAELNRIGIDLMLSGHCHRLDYVEAGTVTHGTVMPEYPVAIGSRIDRKDLSSYAGTALIIGQDSVTVRYTDMEMRVLDEHIVRLKR